MPITKVFGPAITIGILTVAALGADPTTKPAAPAIQPRDAAAASSFIDAFLAGNDAPLLASSTPQLKGVLGPTTLAEVRKATVGLTGVGDGPDQAVVTVVRRVVGDNGAAFEVTASVVDGRLAGFLVRPIK